MGHPDLTISIFMGIYIDSKKGYIPSVFIFSQSSASPRKEILHNIDPLAQPLGEPKYSGTFATSTRAALRVGDWKIITGEPGKSLQIQ